MLKVGFLGNCQAQAMESWSMQASESLHVVSLPPVWLILEEHVEGIIEQIESCDVVFTQRLSDDFARPQLATSRLKERLGSRVISWPNAYFDGYFPGLSYRYHSNGRILGPLDEYHWDLIETSFNAGASVAECVRELETDAIFARFENPVAQSLGQLADREVGLDVIVSDYIAWTLHHQRLFYSMNHPVNSLLREILDRLFGHIGERKRLASLGQFGFPLDKIILPVLPSIRRRHRMTFGSSEPIKGVAVTLGADNYQVTDVPQYYSYTELVECFYRTYEINKILYAD